MSTQNKIIFQDLEGYFKGKAWPVNLITYNMKVFFYKNWFESGTI